MPSRVQIEFAIDQAGVSKRALKDLADRMTDLKTMALDSGKAIDDKVVAAISRVSPRAFREVTDSIRQMGIEADQAAAKVQRLGVARIQGQDLGGASGVPFGPNDASRSLLGRFNRAAQGGGGDFGGASGIQSVGVAAEETAGKVGNLRGQLGQLRRTLQAVGRRGELGSGQEIFGLGGAGLLALGVGGIGLLASVVIAKTQEIRKAAEEALQAVEKTANQGFVSGYQERVQYFQGIQDAAENQRRRIAAGLRASNEDLLAINKASGGRYNTAEEVNAQVPGELAKLRAVRERDRQNLLEEQRAIDRERGSVGFNRDALQGLDARQEAVNKAKQYYGLSDLRNPEEIARAADKKAFDDWKKQREQETVEREKFLRVNLDLAGGQFKLLSSQLSRGENNPFIRIYDEASERARKFQELQAIVGESVVAQFQSMNQRVQALDLFNARLTGQFSVNELSARRDELASPSAARAYEESQGQQRLRAAQRIAGYQTALGQFSGQDPATALRSEIQALYQVPGLIGPQLAEAVKNATDRATPALLERAGLTGTRRQALGTLLSDARRQALEDREPAIVAAARRDLAAVDDIRAGIRPGDQDAQTKLALANDKLLKVLERIPETQLAPDLREAEIRAIDTQIEAQKEQERQALKEQQTQTALLAQIRDALQGKAAGRTTEELRALNEKAAAGPTVTVEVKQDPTLHGTTTVLVDEQGHEPSPDLNGPFSADLPTFDPLQGRY